MISLSMFFLYGCKKDEIQTADDQIEEEMKIANGEIIEKYIVIFKEDAFPDIKGISGYNQRTTKMLGDVKDFLRNKNIPEIIPERVYHTAIKGFSAKLNPMQLDKLKKFPDVSFIEEDKVISLGPLTGGSYSTQAVQTIPYGISRVGWVSSVNGVGKVAWIIDTGIDLIHPDLNVDVSRSVSFLLRGKNAKSPNDENGHGTHVSGTIAAKNNSIGVVGVAANAWVVAVRVLDKNGFGTISGVLNGVDYVATNGQAGNVANISLGGGVSTSLDNAVYNASQKGIFFAIAAGNSSADANNYSPARVNGTYIRTVSAMDSTDTWASFSNYGKPPIDFCAPGVNILSTWKGGTYKRISGTSMATPHVAGVLLMKEFSGTSDGIVTDQRGNSYPIVHL